MLKYLYFFSDKWNLRYWQRENLPNELLREADLFIISDKITNRIIEEMFLDVKDLFLEVIY
jgi:hypothetical protein